MPQKCRFNFERNPKHIIVCEKSEERRTFVKDHYPDVIVTTPEECTASTGAYGAPLGGADVVIEVAGSEDSFQLAWQSARPNATSPWSLSMAVLRYCLSRTCTTKISPSRPAVWTDATAPRFSRL